MLVCVYMGFFYIYIQFYVYKEISNAKYSLEYVSHIDVLHNFMFVHNQIQCHYTTL